MSKTVISVSLPENLAENEKSMFIKNNRYTLEPLNVYNFKNIVITYSGFVFNKKRLVRACIHGYKSKREWFFEKGFRELKYQKEFYLENDNINFLLIHNIWFNYYHWITESIPRLLLVKEKLINLAVLLPEHYKKFDYVEESLKPFNLKKIVYIPKNFKTIVRNAVVPQLKPICSNYSPTVTNEIRERYCSLALQNKATTFGEKIYLSRAKAHRRKVYNEQNVINLLKRFDFDVIMIEDFSFLDQLSIFSNTKFFISIHGAGLTNMQFMRSGTSILELHKRITNEHDHHSLCYWNLASSLGIKYFQQLCDPIDENENFYTADLWVDVNKLESNLLLMLNVQD